MTPRSRRCFITHTECMSITPSEKACLSVSRRRPCPKERGAERTGSPVVASQTHMWNQLGVEAPVCAGSRSGAHLRTGHSRPGWSSGHPDFVRSHLQKTAGEHQTLLEMIPLLPDVQSAWMMLSHCASAGANCHLRVIRPELALQFATTHDQHLWGCLCQILGISTSAAHATAKASATLPLALGGLGLRSAVRTSRSAYWASLADCLPMIARRHPVVAAQVIRSMELGPTIPSLVIGRCCSHHS